MHALEAVTAALEPASQLEEVTREWPDAAGAFARTATPIHANDGVVTVQCSSTLWVRELAQAGPRIVERINAQLGHERVREIVATAAGGRCG